MNVWKGALGDSYTHDFITPLLSRIFPNTKISSDPTRPPDLVIRDEFSKQGLYSCPYICFSGESYCIPHKDYPPILEINTILSDRSNSVWLPLLFVCHKELNRPLPNPEKLWCCSFSNSNRISEREKLFMAMRAIEPTCYAFGSSCRTNDNPFISPHGKWPENYIAFNQFSFNIAMENKVAPGYITEKIGNAFRSGSIPIYWGAPEINDFFNPASFINVANYASPEACGQAAVQIWRDPQKMQPYLDAPITLNSNVDDYLAVYTEYRPWQKKIVDVLRETFPDLS